MPKTKMTFQRLEKKYLLKQEEKDAFFTAIQSRFQLDPFGTNTICNLYFDTEHYDLITTSLQKPPYKEKLRLRSYGIPQSDSQVYLEIKKKCRGIVNKRRIALPLYEAKAYIEEGILPKQSSQILSEIDYFLAFYRPTPKVFLAYDRTPLVAIEDEDLRITFDESIRRRYDHLSLLDGDDGETLFADNMVLMEIKVAGAYPLWLTKILSDLQIYPMSFSKYGTVFMEDIVKKERGMLCSPVY